MDKCDPPLEPPEPPPPPARKSKVGLHIHMMSSHEVQDQAAEMARTGNLAGALIVNDWWLANRLIADGATYVVHRNTDGENSYEELDGTPGDLDRGKAMWEKLGKPQMGQLDSRAYIMIGNESNHGRDGYYWRGMMEAADRDGRKLAIFANSVGHPNAWPVNPSDPHGQWASDVWQHRIDSKCMEYGKAHGHLANLHQYGRHDAIGKPLHEPASGCYPDKPRDTESPLWYGDRQRHVWETILQPHQRMLVFVGEYGYADAHHENGAEVMADVIGGQAMYGDNPYIVAYCPFTSGGHGALGWDYASVDHVMSQIGAFVRSL